jgi:hypothetical protein
MVWVDRTYFALRRRYSRAGIIGSMVAVAFATFHLIPRVHGAEQPLVASASRDIASTATLLLVAACLPPLIAGLCWRLHRRRYLADA